MDLPPPDGPTIATFDPEGISKSRPSKIVTAGRVGYEKETLENLIGPCADLTGTPTVAGMVGFRSWSSKSRLAAPTPFMSSDQKLLTPNILDPAYAVYIKKDVKSPRLITPFLTIAPPEYSKTRMVMFPRKPDELKNVALIRASLLPSAKILLT